MNLIIPQFCNDQIREETKLEEIKELFTKIYPVLLEYNAKYEKELGKFNKDIQ